MELSKKNQELEAFAQFKIYSWEYQNYVSPEDDMYLYRHQSVEADARRYAERATDGYFSLIENYESSGI